MKIKSFAILIGSVLFCHFTESFADEPASQRDTNQINIPMKPDSDNLLVFDACQEKWIDTEIPLHQDFQYPPMTDKKPVTWGRTYRVGSKRIKLQEIDIYHLEKYLTVGASELPESFRGIWWMDGNPLPEVVLSLHNATFDPFENTMGFGSNDEYRYSFLPTRSSLIQWELTYLFASRAKIKFAQDVDLDEPQNGDTGNIDFLTNVFNTGLPLGKMTITFAMDGVWRRETKLQSTSCYTFRRIIDEFGQKLPAYNYFLKRTQERIRESRPDKSEVLLAALKNLDKPRSARYFEVVRSPLMSVSGL